MSTDPWEYVNIKSADECWPWVGSLNNSGYGGHRKIYELCSGEIPAGLVVMHTCNNRTCCNPAHLQLGTQSENIRYAQQCGRVDYRKTSLACRASRKGTGLQYDKRSDTYAIMFKVLGKSLYVGVQKDRQLAQDLAKAALAEVRKLLRTRQGITYEQIKEYFHA